MRYAVADTQRHPVLLSLTEQERPPIGAVKRAAVDFL
jgi:hypothetical protein